MIRLTIAPEPPTFQKEVREPGENVLALLAGQPPPHRCSPQSIDKTTTTKAKSKTKAKASQPNVKQTIEDYPYWRKCLDELHEAYGGICAYYCYYVHKASLPHIDHFIAKKDAATAQAYEWKNYRLASGYANTCKNRFPDVLDPAAIEDGWFQIEDFVSLQVRANPELPEVAQKAVLAAINRLKLNTGRAFEVRQRGMLAFRAGTPIDWLQHDHPFLAKELRRQGITTKEQLPAYPPAITCIEELELPAKATVKVG